MNDRRKQLAHAEVVQDGYAAEPPKKRLFCARFKRKRGVALIDESQKKEVMHDG